MNSQLLVGIWLFYCCCCCCSSPARVAGETKVLRRCGGSAEGASSCATTAVAEEEEANCYDSYRNCLRCCTTDGSVFDSPFSVTPETLALFCRRHRIHIAACLQNKLNWSDSNNGLLACWLELRSHRASGEHSVTHHATETINYAHKIVANLCNRSEELAGDDYCFVKKFHQCVFKFESECLAGCDEERELANVAEGVTEIRMAIPRPPPVPEARIQEEIGLQTEKAASAVGRTDSASLPLLLLIVVTTLIFL